jgi:hypothetical protein
MAGALAPGGRYWVGVVVRGGGGAEEGVVDEGAMVAEAAICASMGSKAVMLCRRAFSVG